MPISPNQEDMEIFEAANESASLLKVDLDGLTATERHYQNIRDSEKARIECSKLTEQDENNGKLEPDQITRDSNGKPIPNIPPEIRALEYEMTKCHAIMWKKYRTKILKLQDLLAHTHNLLKVEREQMLEEWVRSGVAEKLSYTDVLIEEPDRRVDRRSIFFRFIRQPIPPGK